MTGVKRIVGYKLGNFTTDSGEAIHFVHLYYVYPQDGVTGLTVGTAKCLDDSVVEGLNVGSYAELYFNDHKKCVLVNTLPPTDEILVDFGELKIEDLTEDLTEE